MESARISFGTSRYGPDVLLSGTVPLSCLNRDYEVLYSSDCEVVESQTSLQKTCRVFAVKSRGYLWWKTGESTVGSHAHVTAEAAAVRNLALVEKNMKASIG